MAEPNVNHEATSPSFAEVPASVEIDNVRVEFEVEPTAITQADPDPAPTSQVAVTPPKAVSYLDFVSHNYISPQLEQQVGAWRKLQ